MSLEDFNSHQPVEPATIIMPGRAVALAVGLAAFAVDLFWLSLVWAHVLDGMPMGIQGFFLIVMLGSFLGGLTSWKADKIAERFRADLPTLLDEALARRDARQRAPRPPRQRRRRDQTASAEQVARMANGQNVISLPGAESHDAEVISFVSPETLGAARRLSRKVINQEQQRSS